MQVTYIATTLRSENVKKKKKKKWKKKLSLHRTTVGTINYQLSTVGTIKTKPVQVLKKPPPLYGRGLIWQTLNSRETALLCGSFSKSNWCACRLKGHGKVMEFFRDNFVATLKFFLAMSGVGITPFIGPSFVYLSIQSYIYIYYYVNKYIASRAWIVLPIRHIVPKNKEVCLWNIAPDGYFLN